MTPLAPLPKIIVLCGPTASGKSSLALSLARQLGGEIINADSRQIYREFQIGVDKPSEAARAEIPHHLFDATSLTTPWNAAEYIRAADVAIKEIIQRQKWPIIVGGTGLYIKCLLFGLFEGATIAPELRQKFKDRLQREGLASLYTELTACDPEAATRIGPGDSMRILRALEIFESTGQTISQWQAAHRFEEPRYRYQKWALDWPRELLYERINQRVGQMLQDGLLAEVTSLFEAFGTNEVFQKTIGYAEWAPYFAKNQTLEQICEQIAQNSRRLAKRQLTWFRREEDTQWLAGGAGAEEKILKSLENFID